MKTSSTVVPLRLKNNAKEAFHIASAMECDVSACSDFAYAIAFIAEGIEGAEKDAIQRVAYEIVDRAAKIEAQREKIFQGLHGAAFPQSA